MITLFHRPNSRSTPFIFLLEELEAPRSTAGWVPVEEATGAVMRTLSSGPYLLGERFSAADILYATMFALFDRRYRSLMTYGIRLLSITKTV